MTLKKYLIITGKSLFPTLIILFTSLLFSGCEKEKSEVYYYVLGTIHITTDSTLIISDDNERLLITDRVNIGSDIKDNDRILAYFTIKEHRTTADSLYIIDLFSIRKVLTKPVFVLTKVYNDSIGNDPLKVNSLWITKNYLNLDFSFYGYDKKHFINLTRTEGFIPVDTIDLEIRHNNNNDDQYNEMEGLVSFDITTLQNSLKDSVVLHITAKEFNDRIYETYLTYKYRPHVMPTKSGITFQKMTTVLNGIHFNQCAN